MAATEITLPQLGETVEEALIVKWFKQAGESVARGETLLEAETDKITVEVPALASGTITEILAPEGSSVQVGAAIARFVAEGSDVTTETATAAEIEITKPPLRNKLRASPAARRAARDLGIDLERLRESGTGPVGRITKADVLALGQGRAETAPSSRSTASPTAAAPTADTPPSSGIPPTSYADAVTHSPGSTYALTRIEQVSARLTQRSFQEIPHFYVTLKVNVTRTMQAFSAEPESRRVSLNDVLIKVAALALEKHPRLNATLSSDGHNLNLHQRVNIGVITATPEGVITAVVPDAATASLAQIHKRVRDVRSRLQAGRAEASDVSGATFSISNMGMFGVTDFSAIILPPNVAILAVGAVREEVLAEGGRMHIGHTLNLTVSADHRALDGVAVALFLKGIDGLLAEPGSWLEGR